MSAAAAVSRYPRELETTVDLPGVGPALLRPIRPADAVAYRAGFPFLSPEDVRFRFHAPLGALTADMLRRLTQIDYDREMAFVLERRASAPRAPCRGRLAGVVRLAIGGLPQESSGGAEVALLVSPDVRRRGVGSFLLRHAKDYARRRGARGLYGDLLRENVGMIALCARLGCVFAAVPEDARLVRATLALH